MHESTPSGEHHSSSFRCTALRGYRVESRRRKKKKVEHDWVDLLSDGAEEEDGGGRKRSGGSGIKKVRAAKCRSGTQTCGSNIHEDVQRGGMHSDREADGLLQ